MQSPSPSPVLPEGPHAGPGPLAGAPVVESLEVRRGAVPWWTRAFGRAYLAAYGHRDEQEARRHTPSILRCLGLRRASRILDLACGEGRYARSLASAGFRVTGVDLSPELLVEARRASPQLPGAPTYLRGDMRDLPFEQQFEGAVSLFTSFGYFDDPSDDARVLAGVRRALVPGGRFLLDFLNAEEVRANLLAESEEVRAPWRIHTRRWIDDAAWGGPYVRKTIRVVDERTGRVEADVEERVRLYVPEALEAALVAAGLALVGPRMGDLDGNPWTRESPRFVRLSERPSKVRPAFLLPAAP